MIYLFTLPSCAYCPRAKQLLNEKTISYILMDASQPEGLTLARKFQISQVPSLLITDTDENKINLFSGIEEITSNIDSLC